MKILYVSQFFFPERVAAAFRAYENSLIWAELGADITVFTTTPNFPTGKIFNGYKNSILNRESIGGFEVLRNKIIARQNTNIFNRLINYLSFPFFSLFNILFRQKKIGKDYDIVLATTGTIFSPIIGLVFSRIIKKPLVVEFRDLTYKQMLANGTKENALSYKLVKKLELFFCNKANHIVTVTNGFKKVLEMEGIDSSKISVIYNGVEINSKVNSMNIKSKEIHSNRKKIILGYFGTLGKSQNLYYLVDVVNSIEIPNKEIELIFIGDGAEKENLKTYINEKKYRGIQILGNMQRDELDRYYEECDFVLVSLNNNSSFKYTVPSKIFHIMSKKKPILYFGPRGEVTEIISESECGIVIDEKQDTKASNQLSSVLNEFYSKNIQNGELDQMGINGYNYVARNFNRTELAKNYLELLLHLKEENERESNVF
ncbi:glycosyltransferase family 4 protein [Neobacillus drentensis]|uniref:glycosyltransferase family 4 protein n=1 Tax=Neobacillus drentensis TaxID=220684 RepID=UPI000824DCF2|nr:glycosyltransferase family 4 protein [Neobacillus drentensis]